MSAFKLFERLARLKNANWNSQFSEYSEQAGFQVQKFFSEFESFNSSDPVLMDLQNKALPHLNAIDEHGIVKNGMTALKTGGSKTAYDSAVKGIDDIEKKAISYLQGNPYSLETGQHYVPESLKNAYMDAEMAANGVVKPASSIAGIVKTQKDGWSAALKHNGKKMQFWQEGLKPSERALSMLHGSSVIGSVIGMGDAVFRSKTGDGEDRSKLARLAEFVGAGALGTLAVAGGKVTAR